MKTTTNKKTTIESSFLADNDSMTNELKAASYHVQIWKVTKDCFKKISGQSLDTGIQTQTVRGFDNFILSGEVHEIY